MNREEVRDAYINVVEGDADIFKITYKSDLERAALLLGGKSL